MALAAMGLSFFLLKGNQKGTPKPVLGGLTIRHGRDDLQFLVGTAKSLVRARECSGADFVVDSLQELPGLLWEHFQLSGRDHPEGSSPGFNHRTASGALDVGKALLNLLETGLRFLRADGKGNLG